MIHRSERHRRRIPGPLEMNYGIVRSFQYALSNIPVELLRPGIPARKVPVDPPEIVHDIPAPHDQNAVVAERCQKAPDSIMIFGGCGAIDGEFETGNILRRTDHIPWSKPHVASCRIAPPESSAIRAASCGEPGAG